MRLWNGTKNDLSTIRNYKTTLVIIVLSSTLSEREEVASVRNEPVYWSCMLLLNSI